MPKNKSKTTQSQNQTYGNTASYGWQTPPDTEDVKAYRDYRPEVDPSIAFGAANARNRVNSSYVNPLGGQYSAQMEDKLKASANRQIDQDTSQAFRSGQYDQNQQRSGQLGSLAALTSPRLVQQGSSGSSSGSGTSSTTQGQNLFGEIMSAAPGAASMALL